MLSFEKYDKRDYVKISCQIVDKQYSIKYIFKDHCYVLREFDFQFPKPVADIMINKYGIPNYVYEKAHTSKEIEQLRNERIQKGFFKKREGFRPYTDYSALVCCYADDYCQPIANWIKNELIKNYADTRENRIAFTMAFVQDIPYAVPKWENEKFEYWGVLTPPQILIEGWGDCDSKAVLFAGILSYLIDPQDIAFVILGEPAHAYCAIKTDNNNNKTCYELKDDYFAVTETSGGRWLFGECSSDCFQPKNARIEKLEYTFNNLNSNKMETPVNSVELLIFLLDGSGSMREKKTLDGRTKSEHLMDIINGKDGVLNRLTKSTANNRFWVSFIYFGNEVVVAKSTQSNIEYFPIAEGEEIFKDPVTFFNPRSQTAIADALNEAHKILIRFNSDIGMPTNKHSTIFIFTDGKENIKTEDDIKRIVGTMKATPPEPAFATVSFGIDANVELLKSISSQANETQIRHMKMNRVASHLENPNILYVKGHVDDKITNEISEVIRNFVEILSKTPDIKDRLGIK